MRQNMIWQLAVLVLAIGGVSSASLAEATSRSEQVHPQLLAGDRILIGTVVDVRGDEARIDTGEGQPRFVPMGVRKVKGLNPLTVVP